MMQSPDSLSARLRPGERVRSYVLEKYAEKGGSRRLPTMRELAAHLDISLATVQAVYRDLKSEGRITTRSGDGSYLAAPPVQEGERELRILLNYLPTKEELFTSNNIGKIYGGMLHASINTGRRVSFAPLSGAASPEEELKKSMAAGEADGIIIFPHGPHAALLSLIRFCDENAIPYACLQPPVPEAVANFVSVEHFNSGYLIGKAFGEGGRRRVAFLTRGNPVLSTSGWSLSSGIHCGMLEQSGECRMELFNPKSQATMHADLKKWFTQRRKDLPDAIFSHREEFSRSALEILGDMGVEIPKEVSLVTYADVSPNGGDGLAVTRVGAPFIDIGLALIDLLSRRIKHQGMPLPGIKIPAVFASGATTTEVENRVLRVQK